MPTTPEIAMESFHSLGDKVNADNASIRLLIEHTPAAIAMLDREMNYIIVSRRWMIDYNLGDRDLTGLNHYTVFPSVSEVWKERFQQCLAGISLSKEEDMLIMKDGNKVWFRWELCPWYENEQKIGGIIIFTEVITRQKKNLEALKLSESRLAQEKAELTQLNEAGNKLWRIDDFQVGVEAMLDYSTQLFKTDMGVVQLWDKEQQVLRIVASRGFGASFLEKFREVTYEAGTAPARALKLKRQIIIEDIRFDPVFRLYPSFIEEAGFKAVQATPLFDPKGEPIGVISTHINHIYHFSTLDLKKMDLYARAAESFISNFRMKKELQQANEDLEMKVASRTKELARLLAEEKKLGELKSRFVSMASHEFRTPLSTILSSAYLLDKYRTTEEQPKRETHLQRIIASVNTLTDILNEFLSVGRIEEGKIELRYAEFDLKEMVTSLTEEIGPMLKKGQVIHYNHEGEKMANLDPALLKHIILNLLSNAIKFSGEFLPVELLTKNINGKVILKVRDHGIGISREDQKHLKERFFRGANAINIQGTGLGLHIVSKYVELMNGELSYESELGKGTQFCIVFKQ